MPIDYQFITKVLQGFEGKAIATGYVPCAKGRVLGHSGVTIGSGLDLGQHSQRSLAEMGLPMALRARLAPYLGKRGETALAFLHEHPLALGEAEVAGLDKAVIGHYLGKLAQRFDQAAQEAARPLFADRPKEAQAVALSLEYHLGPGGWPRSFKLLVGEAYPALIAELRNPTSWQGYWPRRRAEADLLEGLARHESSARPGYSARPEFSARPERPERPERPGQAEQAGSQGGA